MKSTKRTPPTPWLAAALGLFALVALVYAPALRGQFIWDDDAHLTVHVRDWGGIVEIWTSASANYFPLVLTNFWLQHKLWGFVPAPFHAVSIAFQAACAVLLWRVLRRLGVPGAWLAAAVWAIHPVQVESVAWISELKNTQSCFFYLLAIYWFLRWVDDGETGRGITATARPTTRAYYAAFACAALAILSKASTVMLPCVLALCAWWRGGAWRWRELRALVPFFVLSAAASAWTVWEQRVHQGASGDDWALTLPQRIAVAGRVPWFYLGKLAWPAELTFIYPRWTLDAAAAATWLPLLATVAVGGVVAWRATRGRARAVAFALGVFALSLFPVAGFFNVFFFRYSFVSDHFQHLASMAPIALALGAAARRAERIGSPGTRRALGAALLLPLAAMAARECATYRDNAALWRTTLQRNPEAWIAQSNYGQLLVLAGRPEEALPHYETALRLHPTAPEVHTNLGEVLLKLGRREAALAHLHRALALKPDAIEARYNLAKLHEADGDSAQAMARYREVIALDPGRAEAHNNLGNLLAAAGRTPEALASFAAAIAARPDYADPHFNLARTLAQHGDTAGARAHYAAALQLNPRLADAHNNLGALDAAERNFAGALAHYAAALAIAPDHPRAHNNLGLALQATGRLPEAIPHFEAALRTDPAYADAAANLGTALLASGRPAEAVAFFERALQLSPAMAEAHFNLAAALRTLGRTDEAAAHQAEAVRLRPDLRAAPR